MQKKTVSFSILAISVAAFILQALPTQAGFVSQTYQTLADYAIQLTKQSTTYGTYTVPSTSTTITLHPSVITTAEQEFKNQVNIAWTNGYPIGGYAGFLNNLAGRNQNILNTVNNTSLDINTRASAMLSDDFYKNYILLRNNPKFNNGNMAGIPNTIPYTNTTPYSSNRLSGYIFTPTSSYTTSSQKTYYIRSSQNGRYRFSTSNTINDIRHYEFYDLSSLYNHLEYQNRIIHVAPNSRRYGIFKYNNAYRFNRDEGSISSNEWVNIADVKAYIDQHNQPVKGCTLVKQRHCIQ